MGPGTLREKYGICEPLMAPKIHYATLFRRGRRRVKSLGVGFSTVLSRRDGRCDTLVNDSNFESSKMGRLSIILGPQLTPRVSDSSVGLILRSKTSCERSGGRRSWEFCPLYGNTTRDNLRDVRTGDPGRSGSFYAK